MQKQMDSELSVQRLMLNTIYPTQPLIRRHFWFSSSCWWVPLSAPAHTHAYPVPKPPFSPTHSRPTVLPLDWPSYIFLLTASTRSNEKHFNVGEYHSVHLPLPSPPFPPFFSAAFQPPHCAAASRANTPGDPPLPALACNPIQPD